MSRMGRIAGRLLSASLRRAADAPTPAAVSLVEAALPASGLDRVAANPIASAGVAVSASGVAAVRMARSGADVLAESLAGKILGNWLQNRHQTLYPLALNFRNHADDDIAILLDTIAVALLATGPASPERIERVFDWLRSAGATDVHRVRLAYAIDHAPALHDLLARIEAAHQGPHAFAVALAALDQRESVNRLFLEYLAGRLGLPSDMARSLAQRFRL